MDNERIIAEEIREFASRLQERGIDVSQETQDYIEEIILNN